MDVKEVAKVDMEIGEVDKPILKIDEVQKVVVEVEKPVLEIDGVDILKIGKVDILETGEVEKVVVDVREVVGEVQKLVEVILEIGKVLRKTSMLWIISVLETVEAVVDYNGEVADVWIVSDTSAKVVDRLTAREGRRGREKGLGQLRKVVDRLRQLEKVVDLGKLGKIIEAVEMVSQDEGISSRSGTSYIGHRYLKKAQKVRRGS